MDQNDTSARQTLIAGHSHVFALQFSSFAKETSPEIVPTPFSPEHFAGFATVEGPYSNSYWDCLVEHAAGRDILILWLGSQHLAEFLFQDDQAFDFLLASHPELGLTPGAQIVPEELVRAYQMQKLNALDDVLTRLSQQPGCRVFVGATPPPKGDDGALRLAMMSEPYFQTRAEMLSLDIAKIALTPRTIRLKFWLVIDELVRDTARRHQAGYIGVPPQALDGEGFLRREYWENDVGHANALYGELYLENALTHIHARVRA